MYFKKIILSSMTILLGTVLITNYVNASTKNNNPINYSKKSALRLNKAGYVFEIPKRAFLDYKTLEFTKSNFDTKNNRLLKNFMKKAITDKHKFRVIDAKQNGSQFMYKIKDKSNKNNFWIFYSDITNKYLNNKEFKILANKENNYSDPNTKITYKQLKSLVNKFKGKDKKVADTSLKETVNYKKSREEIYDTPSLLHIG